MQTRFLALGLVSLITILGAVVTGRAQTGVAERAGQKIDDVGRGVTKEVRTVGEALRKRFELVRTDVHRMGTHPRVYARIHWDRALHGSRIEVHMLRGGAVLLRGTVPDLEAKRRAVALASDTVDVTSVIDELTVVEPAVVKGTATK